MARGDGGKAVFEDDKDRFDFLYRKAVPSQSSGLAHRAYPGTIHRTMINPNGAASSSGIDAPSRTQPRWG